MKCSNCGKRGLRSATLVHVAKGSQLVRVRVCGTCAGRAVTILPAEPLRACACGEAATTCSKCADKGADKAKRGASDAKTLAKHLRLRARVYRSGHAGNERDYSDGIEAGLEQAADFLEKGAWP